MASSHRDSSHPIPSNRARIGWIVPEGSPTAVQICSPYICCAAAGQQRPEHQLHRIVIRGPAAFPPVMALLYQPQVENNHLSVTRTRQPSGHH